MNNYVYQYEYVFYRYVLYFWVVFTVKSININRERGGRTEQTVFNSV